MGIRDQALAALKKAREAKEQERQVNLKIYKEVLERVLEIEYTPTQMVDTEIEGLHFNLFTRDDDNDYEPVTDRTAQLDRYEDVFIGVAGTDRGQKRSCWFVVNHLAALGKLLEDHRIANNSVDFENIEFYAVRNPWLQ